MMDSRTIGIPLNFGRVSAHRPLCGLRVTWSGVRALGPPGRVNSAGIRQRQPRLYQLSPANAAWYFDAVTVGASYLRCGLLWQPALVFFAVARPIPTRVGLAIHR